MGDIFAILLTVLLMQPTGSSSAAEFALISARRDRLEALAEQGKRSATAVIRAGENLSMMLAGAQLGITVCSIALGRVGEPAVAHILHKPFDLLGVPDAVLHTVSFVVAITVVVILHVLLGEMVPKNIALAGPEKAAMLLVPPYLLWVRATRPVIAVYDWCARIVVRALGVEPKTELENAVSMVELSEMIAESLSEGLLDPEEHMRLSRALQIRNRVVNDVAVPLADIQSVPVAPGGSGPTVGAIEASAGQDRLLALPGTRRDRPVHRIRPHQGRAGAGRRLRGRGRRRRGAPAASAAGRHAAARRPVPAAPGNSHLALVTAPDGSVCAMVALEDLVEDLVGTVRDGMHRG